ncbi:DUF1801 domain-containing protein [Leptospira langatensis]|uniref:DUF1801 domain-containing protein n=1 Tax=Leptospira langatensis TaxID=2484983 RepID=A0A5F1ZQQ1_9LEPT|nr:DUF1801 domain-containing protein [Leptospira langatensis]TGK02814.1 DUF1801 domain-containing protein [Leptospira langatensis]TGL39981.1 DUF1801 domain-containing protein [Leptospira langatensis]
MPAKKKSTPRPKKSSPKKVAPKKTSSPKKKTEIKYSDKSSGQPELVRIFTELKRLILPYHKGSIQLRGDSGGQFNLVSEKEISVVGKKKPEVFFATLLVQKGYVGFYFMPVYSDPDVKKQVPKELLSCLKGKSCFHIKKSDPLLYSQIEEILQIGYDKYRSKNWVD